MSTKTTFKRIALVAVASLGFGVLTSVAPASATAATGTVTPVSVSYTDTTLDGAPYARISWASTLELDSDDTVTVTLTSAPTTAAIAFVVANTSIGAARSTPAANAAGADSLADATSTSIAYGAATAAAATASMGIQANVSGFYRGTLTVTADGVLSNTVSFSFTTRGKAVSYTATASAASVSPSGTSTLTVTLLDSAGNTTQPGMFDSFGIADGTSTGTFAGSATSLTLATAADPLATNLYDGTAAIVYTAPSTENTISTITVTPAGTLGSLAAQTLTVTTDATTINATAVTAYAVTAPADAAEQTGTLTAGTLATPVRAGTSTVTIAATSSAPAGSTLRFSAVASAGTVDGASTAVVPVYKTATVSSLGTATVTYTLAGNATLVGATLTINQVTVANADVSLTKLVVTQTAAAAAAGTIENSVGANLVRALGTTTSVDVTVEDQFGENLGAGWTVQSFRVGTTSDTLLSTATTNASGVATVTITPLSTVVTGGSETYNYKVSRPGISAITATGTTAVTYTTTGGITSMSAAIVGQSGTGILTPVLHTTTVAAQAVIPAVRVVTTGSARDAVGTGIYTVATGVQSGGDTAETLSRAVQITTTNVPANSTTYTVSAGAALCTSVAIGSCAWDAGLSTRTVAAGSSIFAYATTTGVHTITATSGDKTTTIRFFAYNAETDYYTVSAAADSTSIKTGQTGVITVNVKDIFGNAVDTTGSLLTATASGKVRLAGQALTQTIDTGVNGTFAFTVLADATAGSGTITIAPTTTGANAWGASYVAPTGAAAPVSSATLTFTVEGATLKTVDDLAAAQAEAAAKAAADKASSDAALAALKAQLDAAAAKAAADKASSDAAIAAAQAAAVEAATAATDAATEALDAANAATDAANASAEAADAATAAAQDSADAVAALSTQVSEMISALKKQITALTNLVIKIQRKVRA
jgi:trimeric autotransporter adhesin